MRAKMLFASEILGIQTAPTFEFENGKFIYGFDEGKLMNELGL